MLNLTNHKIKFGSKNMKKIIVAAAALVKNGKLFIAQRPADKLPPLVWEFPGGT